ncbi:MAG TPA: hypothetical protein VGF79_15105 [Bacteroidia bacterium]
MRIKLLIITTLCFFASTRTWAQNNTSSPYSIRAYGEMESFSSAFSKSLGGAINGIRSSRSVSFGNPASLGAIKIVNLDFGFRLDYSEVYSDVARKTSNNGNFNYFALSFPVYRKPIVKKDTTIKTAGNITNKLYTEYDNIWCTSFGFSPYSSINAGYNKTIDTTYGQLYNAYSRIGGLNRVYLMNAVNLSKNFSLGLNVNYIFGQSKSYDGYFVLDTGVARVIVTENNISMRGFKFDFGFQGSSEIKLNVRVKEKVNQEKKDVKRTMPLRFVYGATLYNGANLNYSIFRQILNRNRLSSGYPTDTVLYEENNKGKTQLPLGYSAGFSVTFNKVWMLTADYRSEGWGNINKTVFSDSFTNSSQFNIGFAFRPDSDIPSQLGKKKRPFLEYRVGFRSLNTGYLFKDNQGNINPLKEYGISFGIGIPKIIRQWDGKFTDEKSLINLTAEYIRRGSTMNGMVAENLYRLTIGFTLTNIWFTQRKIY